MFCFNNCYLPQPPRAWSRVQNSCSNTEPNGLVRDPYTGQIVTSLVLAEKIAMLNKGNVLQYKANSSNITKAQKYSKIARGQWINRNTTWAVQSTRGYTNPNTHSLKRTGNITNIAIDPITGAIIGPTTDPVTCINNINSNNISVKPIVIQDGGSLICSIQENICTGETKTHISQQLCNSTTDSDVPGPIQDLCWNDGTQTWYPRQRYIMTNSTNKWPTNAKLFGAIQIYPPYITSITNNQNIVTLIWQMNNICLEASNFNIYQNGVIVKVVAGNILTTDVVVENNNHYEYYIVAENIRAKIVSENSNIVTINII